jgi:hypothetical protein
MVNGLIFFVLSLVGGGVGTWLLSWSWASYFRERDFLADKFVVACDLKDELIAYLEENRFYDTSVPFMLNWQPANEQRIDKLEPREAIHVVEEVPNEPDEDFITLFERVVREERLKRGGTLVVEEKPNESVVSLSDRLWKVYPNLSDEEAEDLVESRFFEALWEIEQIERRKGDLERELPAWVKEYIEEKERDK